MSYVSPSTHLAYYQRRKAALLEAFPELAEDEQALLDTLEGETEFHEALALMVRKAQQAAAYSAACTRLEAVTAARGAHWDKQEEALREAVLDLMQSAGLKKLQMPDFTVSVSHGRGKVVITDEAALPDAMFRTTRSPDKTAIGDALKGGQTVPGALLSNLEPTLTVRTR